MYGNLWDALEKLASDNHYEDDFELDLNDLDVDEFLEIAAYLEDDMEKEASEYGYEDGFDLNDLDADQIVELAYYLADDMEKEAAKKNKWGKTGKPHSGMTRGQAGVRQSAIRQYLNVGASPRAGGGPSGRKRAAKAQNIRSYLNVGSSPRAGGGPSGRKRAAKAAKIRQYLNVGSSPRAGGGPSGRKRARRSVMEAIEQTMKGGAKTYKPHWSGRFGRHGKALAGAAALLGGGGAAYGGYRALRD